MLLWARSSLAGRLSKAVQSQGKGQGAGGTTMESWEIEGPVLEWESAASEQLARLRALRQILMEISEESEVCMCVLVRLCTIWQEPLRFGSKLVLWNSSLSHAHHLHGVPQTYGDLGAWGRHERLMQVKGQMLEAYAEIRRCADPALVVR